MTFTNKVVLVSGAGSGIGKATAIAFAKLTAKLSLFDKNEETLANTAGICKEFNDNVLETIADVTNDEELRKVVENTLSEFGRIDVVVNCAGAFRRARIVDTNFMDSYDWNMNLNLRSIVLLTNLVTPSLIASKGNIVNIASTSAKIVTPGCLPYDMSKSALNRFTKCIALELADKGVRANSILPGPVKTNILTNSRMFPEENIDRVWESMANSTALGRCADVEEVAELVLYLASDKARSITGAEYSIDCGLLLVGVMKLDQ